MRPPANAIQLADDDPVEVSETWGLWADIRASTDWNQTWIDRDTTAAFAVIFSSKAGSYAIFLGIERGGRILAPEEIKALGKHALLVAEKPRRAREGDKDDAA